MTRSCCGIGSRRGSVHDRRRHIAVWTDSTLTRCRVAKENGVSSKPGGSRREAGRAERLARYRRGRLSELLAAALLMAKGYRILARRCRTPYGEIDLIALRGSRLAF